MACYLVTGGAGFIGSNLVDALIAHGHKVVVLDNLSNGNEKHINSQCRFFKMDIQDPGIRRIFKQYSFDAVFHLAAQIDVRTSVADPVSDAQENIVGSLNLITTCIDHGVKKFIYSSSGGAIFHREEILPAAEHHKPEPYSPYGITKLAVEHYLEAYSRTHGLHSVALRYANVYGPRQKDMGDAAVVAVFINRLLQEQPIIVYGDGNQTRDFVYVGDAVKANILALNDSRPGSFVYHVSSRTEITVNQLLQEIQRVLGTAIIPTHAPGRQGEIYRSVLDYTKISQELGWKPDTDMYNGLRETIAYFSQM